MANKLFNEDYANTVFQNTLEWIYGYRKYLQWYYSTFYDEEGKFITSTEHIVVPMEFRKYYHPDSAACELASALLADDPFNSEDVAKIILSCRDYKFKKEHLKKLR